MYEPDPGGTRSVAAERAAARVRGRAARRSRRIAGPTPATTWSATCSPADLEADELVGTAALLLMAGHEATVNVIGNGVLALLRHPAQWGRLVRGPRASTRQPSRS